MYLYQYNIIISIYIISILKCPSFQRFVKFWHSRYFFPLKQIDVFEWYFKRENTFSLYLCNCVLFCEAISLVVIFSTMNDKIIVRNIIYYLKNSPTPTLIIINYFHSLWVLLFSIIYNALRVNMRVNESVEWMAHILLYLYKTFLSFVAQTLISLLLVKYLNGEQVILAIPS